MGLLEHLMYSLCQPLLVEEALVLYDFNYVVTFIVREKSLMSLYFPMQ